MKTIRKAGWGVTLCMAGLAAWVLCSCDKEGDKEGKGGQKPREEASSEAQRVDQAQVHNEPQGVNLAQVSKWSGEDMRFFLNGSMSAEFLPEKVLWAFYFTYPELFPNKSLTDFGLTEGRYSDQPVGVTKKEVKHLGGLMSLGVNCAACHTGHVLSAPSAKPIRVLGMTGTFDAEAFYNTLMLATFKTAEPANMERFLGFYYEGINPRDRTSLKPAMDGILNRQREQIAVCIKEDPTGSKGVEPGQLHEINPDDLRLDHNRIEKQKDIIPIVKALLKLFHNMRTALHVPDQPPKELPPASGPGRNNPWGLLSYSLFGVPTLYAPVKYMPTWNLAERSWVHCDGNNRFPIQRNLAASLGLGAPLLGRRGVLDFALVKHHTELSEQIRAPRYPFAIDKAMAERGAKHFQARCASCHSYSKSEDAGFNGVDVVKTDANRVKLFDDRQAAMHSKFYAELQVDGYRAPAEPGFRSTKKYWAGDLAGVWARAPYLHNGSVRTVWELLQPAAARPKTWKRGTRVYDQAALGFADEGSYVFDAKSDGNSNGGHEYGTDLGDEQKRELIEYLKTK